MTWDEQIKKLRAKTLVNTDPYKYQRIHLWINREMGKASHCSFDSTHKSTRYHWSNISGKYKKDLSDWRQLCPSCNIKSGYTDELRQIKRLQALGHSNNCQPILQLFPNGAWIKYGSTRDASIATGILRTAITNALTGYTRSAGGFKWQKVGG